MNLRILYSDFGEDELLILPKNDCIAVAEEDGSRMK